MVTDIAVGIDIGGTNTVFGLVDRTGSCLADSSVPTQSHVPVSALVERLTGAIAELQAPLSVTSSIVGIGIGAPNANYHRGTIENPPNLGWRGITPIVSLFRERFAVPVAITNDANAAALGEVLFGAAKGMRDVIVITLGTGLGSGIVANGDLVYGADGFAGEIGHTTVDPNGRFCGCGRRGCLETYASAPGICRTVFELLSVRRDDSSLRAISFNDMTAKLVAEAAGNGDVIAKMAFEETGRILGMKLAESVAHTSPEAIVLFGGLANAGDLLFIPTRASLEAHLLNAFQGRVKLLPSGLPEGTSAVLGAAALLWKELDKTPPRALVDVA
ncbi:MAG: ROK family protein [Acidobacteria bacterium]|nr:ROK family protein [Acidobacteriota bacterium]